MPTVSVIIPSYNHEKYIEECIISVLNQTYQDFEIVITDDGSTDSSVDIIRNFKDPRIKLFIHSSNKGACVTSNNCINHSQGKYIAMLSSDDAWYPEKLELQVDYLEHHPEIPVVFGKVDWIDESGNFYREDFPYYDVFDVENRSRFEWLHHFFYYGNCLCHPCSLIRKDCYLEVGLLNPLLANLPDFDLWIRFCTKYNLHILDQSLIKFRRIGEDKNASGVNNSTLIRNRFEHKIVMNNYLRIQDPEDLLKVFPDVNRFGKVQRDAIPYLLARLAIDTGMDLKMMWGLDLIYMQMNEKRISQILSEEYNFSPADFIRLSGTCDIYHVTSTFPIHSSTLLEGEPIQREILLSETISLKEELERKNRRIQELEDYLNDLYRSKAWKLTRSIWGVTKHLNKK